MNQIDPFEKLRYRDVFPALKPYVSDYECWRFVFWLFALGLIIVALAGVAWGIEWFLKRKGFR